MLRAEPEENALYGGMAFFGGSFDPPHQGHLAIARAAQTAFALDTVLFAPVGAQPLKPEGPTASFDDRVAMTRLAIAGEPGFEVSLADAPKPDGKPNYTFETLIALRAALKENNPLYCLMGADSFAALPRWHRAAEIPFAADLIVASRPGEAILDRPLALPPGLSVAGAPNEEQRIAGVEVRSFTVVNQVGARATIYVLPGLHVDISASEIRREWPQPAGMHEAMLPEAVRQYIEQHGLYR